jgi:UDP-2,3-diacylglucosamine hydrolase
MNTQLNKIPFGKKVFVASDFHLGAPNHAESLAREKKIVGWLDSITSEAHAIVLAGDVFDFWFEYKNVVPKGYVRLFGKLANMSDSGIKILVFTGNHDLWMADYLIKEIGAIVYHTPQSFIFDSQKILIGHGDGLGPGDHKFKVLKKIFTSKINMWLFGWIHPDIGIWLGNLWSRRSRKHSNVFPDPYLGDQEPLHLYCQEIEKTDHHDFYIFGHRHLSLNEQIGEKARYINLGDWITFNTYVEITNDGVNLITYEG